MVSHNEIHLAKDKECDGSLVWGIFILISKGAGKGSVFPGNLTPKGLFSGVWCLMAKAAATSYNSEVRLYFLSCEPSGCSSKPPTDSSLLPAMSLQSAPLPLSTGTLQTPCTRVLSQPCGLDSKPSQLQHRGRWDGEGWCALRARLLPFGGGMSVWDLCCCM